MKQQSKYAVAASVVLLAICGHFIYLAIQSHAYRAKLVSFSAELAKSHADRDAVRELMSQDRFNGLKLREGSDKLWVVETPIEFGARNWILLIELRGVEVASLRFRTEDSTDKLPEGAPPDRRF